MDSIVDCNYILRKSIDELVQKLTQNELRMKSVMDQRLVDMLRQGVMASPLVEEEIKQLIRD